MMKRQSSKLNIYFKFYKATQELGGADLKGSHAEFYKAVRTWERSHILHH